MQFPQRTRRLKKAMLRNSKVIRLHINKPRLRVYSAAVMKELLYGAVVDGIAPTSRRMMRRRLAHHAGWRPGMCTTTLLAIELPGEDPQVFEHSV